MKFKLTLLLLFVCSFSLNAQTTAVGTTEGVFNVSDLGAATYSIPIKIPEGIAGMQPNLSLSYSSMSGNGIMGMGWSLNGGISAVSRISESIYNDKKVKGVSLTPEDRFSLDGQRLIITGGSSYGAANTIYRTEVESFKEVKAIGTLGSGPSSFEVTDLQSGTKFIYGTKALSRPTVQGKVEPYMWLLDKVTDLNGNYMEFTYQYNAGEEPRIANINYTGNVTTGAAPKSVISFYYENRPDANFSYVAGGKIVQGQRLKFIYVQQKDAANNPVTVHSYELQYTLDQYTHLSKVIEKGHEINGVPEQLPATEVTYGGTSSPVTMTSANAAGGGASFSSITGDFNADGKTDILQYLTGDRPASIYNSQGYSLYLNTGSGFTQTSTGGLFQENLPQVSSNSNASDKYPAKNKSGDGIPFDYDADGYEDFLYTQDFKPGWGTGSGQIYTVYRSLGTGFLAYKRIKPSSGDNFYDTKSFMGDFDGDGQIDILLLNTKKGNANNNYIVGAAYNTATSTTTLQGTPIERAKLLPNMPFDAAYLESNEAKLFVIDYNGDGKSDILSIWRDEAAGVNHAQVLEMNVIFDANNKPVIGNPVFKLVSDNGYPTLYHDVLPGDFNGDRITDVLTWVYGLNNGWQIGYGKGDGSMTDIRAGVTTSSGGGLYFKPEGQFIDHTYRPVLVGDYNGDGKTDIFDFSVSDGTSGFSYVPAKVLYSLGNDKFVTENLNLPNEGILGKQLNDYRPGDFNGDGSMDLCVINPSNKNYYMSNEAWTGNIFYFHAFESKHLIANITDGVGSTTKINYLPLTDYSIYSPGSSAYKYPIIKKTVAMKVVSGTIHDNGINQVGNSTTYYYGGLKYHVYGKGILGFDQVIITDYGKGIVQEKTFSLDTTYAFPYLSSTLVKTLQVGQLLSIASNMQQVYHYGMRRILPYTTSTTATDYIKNTTVTETLAYNWPASNVVSLTPNSAMTGKPISVTTNKGNGLETAIQTFTYPNLQTYSGQIATVTPSWVYMKPKSISNTNTRQGQSSYTRKQDFAYSNSNGLLLSSVSDPATAHAQTTTNTYNQYGNLIQKTISASGASPRTEVFEYDATNRLLIKSYNVDYPALQTNTVYDIVTGTVKQIKQADGLIKSFTYDGFNRLKTTTDNNGGLAITTNIWASGNALAPANAKYAVTTSTNTASGISYTFYDRLGREIRSVSPSLNGQMVFVDQSFDNKGQLISKSDPYFQGGAIQNNTFTYDNLGRITYQSTPSGNNTSFTYAATTSGALITVTNAVGQSKKTYTDKASAVIKTEDEGGVLEYTYHSNGKVKTTTLNGTTVQQYEYDPYGRNIKRTDPNYGSYQYSYDNFDQLLSEEDPKGQVYNYTYNGLGKMTTKSGPEGTYAYIYNTTGGPNTGKLVQLTGPNGVTHSYNYGVGDKINYEQRTIGNETFKTEFIYDIYGRVKTKKYPNNVTVEYTYNANTGSLQSIGRPGATYTIPGSFGGSKSASAYLYSVIEENAFGQTTKGGYQSQYISGPLGTLPYTFVGNTTYNNYGILTGQNVFKQANNYSTAQTISNYSYNFQPSTGNLLQRKDLKYSLREDFTYDNVNRLTSIQGQYYGQYPVMFTPQTMNYAQNGNITQKADAGTFGYDQANRVSEINPYMNIPTTTQNITYTSFDKVLTIDEAPNRAQFTYWADVERAKMELLENNMLKKTKYYAPNFEKEIDATTGQVRELCYIYGPDNDLVSIIEKKNGVEQTYFVQTDYLGSITQIFDGNGTIIEEKSFDAWGRARNPQSWQALPPTMTSNGWDRGYTGQEHLTQFGIINLNGRLYDPLMGRMMEPDPLIIGENNSQGYNRYSYALNNPLKYTDPTGHDPILVAAAIGAAVSAAMYTANVALSEGGFRNWDWGQFATGTLVGGMSGAATAGIGELFGPVLNASGALANGVMGEVARAAVHGASSYIFGATSGNTGWSNFIAGAVGSLSGIVVAKVPILQTNGVASLGFSMTMGGVSSSITGGNFLEGAVTAGLVHELNFQLHKDGKKDARMLSEDEIDYSVEESQAKFDADWNYIKNGKGGWWGSRWWRTVSRDWNARDNAQVVQDIDDLKTVAEVLPMIRIGKMLVPKGFTEVKSFGYKHGQKVFHYKGKYYSRDVGSGNGMGSHNGGVWKVFELQNGKLNRIGTADQNLKIFKK